MNDLLKVKGHDKLSKDAQSGAVINIDRDGLLSARAAKRRLLESRTQITELEQRIEDLETLFAKLIGEKS